jgi:hypothetical protein
LALANQHVKFVLGGNLIGGARDFAPDVIGLPQLTDLFGKRHFLYQRRDSHFGATRASRPFGNVGSRRSRGLTPNRGATGDDEPKHHHRKQIKPNTFRNTG